MNIIKKTLLLIGFFSILTSTSLAQYEYAGLTFGEENGKICRFGASGKKTADLEAQIIEHLAKCEDEKRNPFEWDQGAPDGVNVIFRVSGDLDKIHSLAQKSADKRPSWIWAGAKSITSMKIHLCADGTGWINFYEGDRHVGASPCQTSERKDQPAACQTSLGTKCTESKGGSEMGHLNHKKQWMAWAIPIKNKVEGIFIHAGSFLNYSLGCVRIPHPYAQTVYQMAGKGCGVCIIHE